MSLYGVEYIFGKLLVHEENVFKGIFISQMRLLPSHDALFLSCTESVHEARNVKGKMEANLFWLVLTKFVWCVNALAAPLIGGNENALICWVIKAKSILSQPKLHKQPTNLFSLRPHSVQNLSTTNLPTFHHYQSLLLADLNPILTPPLKPPLPQIISLELRSWRGVFLSEVFPPESAQTRLSPLPEFGAPPNHIFLKEITHPFGELEAVRQTGKELNANAWYNSFVVQGKMCMRSCMDSPIKKSKTEDHLLKESHGQVHYLPSNSRPCLMRWLCVMSWFCILIWPCCLLILERWELLNRSSCVGYLAKHFGKLLQIFQRGTHEFLAQGQSIFMRTLLWLKKHFMSQSKKQASS